LLGYFNRFSKRVTAENLSLSQNRKSAQKGVKRRQKAQKGDFMAEKGAHMAPKGAKMRILAPFGAFWRNGKKHSVFQLFFNIFFYFY
jgi:hypothetical protein